MKILKLGSLTFQLPEDFTGGLSDSLRLVADYIDLPKDQISQETVTPCKSEDDIWEEFLRVHNNGRKLFITNVGLVQWVDNEWVDLPLNTGGGL